MVKMSIYPKVNNEFDSFLIKFQHVGNFKSYSLNVYGKQMIENEDTFEEEAQDGRTD